MGLPRGRRRGEQRDRHRHDRAEWHRRAASPLAPSAHGRERARRVRPERADLGKRRRVASRRCPPRRGRLGPRRPQAVHHQRALRAGRDRVRARGRARSAEGLRRDHRLPRPARRARRERGSRGAKARPARLGHERADPRRCARRRRRGARRGRKGLRPRHGRTRWGADQHRRAIDRDREGGASPGALVREGAPAVWPPHRGLRGRALPARRARGPGRRRAAAHASGRLAARSRPALHARSGDGQALRERDGAAGHARGGTDARRQRLHARVRRRAKQKVEPPAQKLDR